MRGSIDGLGTPKIIAGGGLVHPCGIVLDWVAVPEPGSVALFTIDGATLIVARIP